MPTFAAYDGTVLAYHVFGSGDPLVCLPGGPMQASAYLGELGGLSAHRRLIMLDLRGTGDSAIPADPATYRCDRLVDDVEALREHLGLERMDLLSHSGGTNLAASYVARHQDRIGRLVLVTPSVFAVGIAITGELRLETARLRSDEPWYAQAYAALERITTGQGTEDDWNAMTPFSYGHWDEATRAHKAAEAVQRNDEAAAVYASDGAFDVEAIRTALGRFSSPVLLIAGQYDVGAPPPAIAEYAALFPDAHLTIQPTTAHFPWLDNPDPFVKTVATFLA